MIFLLRYKEKGCAKKHKESALEVPQALSDFSFVLVYLLAAALFALGPILLAYLIAPRSYGASRDAIYECGLPGIGSAWIRVNVTKMEDDSDHSPEVGYFRSQKGKG
jgi:hypothetical protein